MKVNEVKTPEDSDFKEFVKLCEERDGWTETYRSKKGTRTSVMVKPFENSSYQMIRVNADFTGISAELLYDVLHDTSFRYKWDTSMIESYELCYVDCMSDISYYSMRCPKPMKNRDFVAQRSWLFDGHKYIIFNHSIQHKLLPPQPHFIRALSFLTGFCVEPMKGGITGCHFSYIAHFDPKGLLPIWLVNLASRTLAPRVVKKLVGACKKYDKWKKQQPDPNWKPWINPEQLVSGHIPKLDPKDLVIEEMPSRGSSVEDLTGLQECNGEAFVKGVIDSDDEDEN